MRVLGRVPIEVYGSSETGGIAWRQQAPGKCRAWMPFRRRHLADRTQRGRDRSALAATCPTTSWFRLADRAEPRETICFFSAGASIGLPRSRANAFR